MSINLSITVYNWLRELKIPVSKTLIKYQLLSHPDYPSLLSITDTLTELGIENTAVQIEKDNLNEVDTPIMAHLKSNGGEFVMIKDRSNLDKQAPDFSNRWDGVLIAAKKPGNWRHKLNEEWLKKDSIRSKGLLFTISILALFIFLSGITSFDWGWTELLLIAIAGIFVSWMIVSKDLGIENKIADQICGTEADCSSVIIQKL